MCGYYGGSVTAYVRSAMNNLVSNAVIIEFSKRNEIGWTYPYWCLFVSLFSNRLSYEMHSWLCDV